MITIGFNRHMGEVIFHSPFITAMSLEFFARYISNVPQEYRILASVLRNRDIVPKCAACVLAVKASNFSDINELFEIIDHTMREVRLQFPAAEHATFEFEIGAQEHIQSAILGNIFPVSLNEDHDSKRFKQS